MPMIKTFTQTDLIRFLYHETTEEENAEIKRALQYDPDLTLQFDELKNVVTNLDNVLMKPPAASVEKILAYSRNSE